MSAVLLTGAAVAETGSTTVPAPASAPAPAASPGPATAPAATEPAPAPAAVSDLDALLAQADALWSRREPKAEGEVNDQLVAVLEDASRRFADSYEVWWRLSRAYWWRSDGAKGKEARGAWGRKGMDAGDRARGLNADDVRGHYFAAIGTGGWAQGMGLIKALRKGVDGKFGRRLDRALELSGGHDCGGPYISKGRYYYELPWPKYDEDKSIEWLNKALEVCPDNVRANVYLAETYLKEGETEKAGTHLEKALEVKPSEFWDPPEAHRMQRIARALQEELAR